MYSCSSILRFLEAVNSSLQAYLNSIPPKKLLFIVYNLCVLEACPDFAVNKLLQYESILSKLLVSFCLP